MELEKHLVLNKYFLNLFGLNDFDELRGKLRDVQEGYDSDGRSHFVNVLKGLRPDWEAELLRYDSNIKTYVERLKRNRMQPKFNLKYFQYLAILFTEIFLEKCFDNKSGFLNELNEFLQKFNQANKTKIEPFTEEEFKKLAFWMATGSGKTLVMHVNYWQIRKYFDEWDNIILITPNEGLSKQHFEEMKLSGIPCKLYDGNLDSLKTKDGEVLIIDVHKLTKEKKGEGVRVDVSYFDGKNLVFIDEGHKGQKSEEQKWKKLREEIARNGFLFEYSATFGQIIGKNEDLLDEYAKAIIFDYSYKYFYTDGYGKDFHIYNLKAQEKKEKKKKKKNGKEIEVEEIVKYYPEEQVDLLLVANLLSFYEQLTIFENYYEELREYNIEKPLWIFVGSKVTGSGLNSDVVKILRFLDKVLKDEDFLKEKVKKILDGKSGLIDKEGNDIFRGKFEYIREFDPETIVSDIYQKVFNGRGNLSLYEIKNADGEIGLKTSTGEKYFGVINIGNVRDLKKLIKDYDIEVEEDHMSQSLFSDIKSSNSPLNILIGSKKFVEGWDTWRVSVMGLINMGKGEGPQIIQLFGRGVRLKGKDYSLKREENPDYKVKVLQTLLVFGLNADYMDAFLKAIEQEEVNYEEIEIPITFNRVKKWEKKIHTIKVNDNFDFLKYKLELENDDGILSKVKLDLRPKITLARGLNVESVDSKVDEPVKIPEEYFDLIDWQYIYSELMDYKLSSGFYNLVIKTEVVKDIAKSQRYEVFLLEDEDFGIESGNRLKIKSFKGIRKFQDIILLVLKDYISKFYRTKFKQESMNHLEVEALTIDDHPHMYPEDRRIIVKVPRDLIDDIKDILEQLRNYEPDICEIPEKWKKWDSFIVHFDKHLYTPLIVYEKNKKRITSFPVKLNEGETEFVRDLKAYFERYSEEFEGKDIFLLRNLSKRGIGFFVGIAGFYPDFILWVKEEDKERMIFIDPKGIRNIKGFHDEKVQFCVSYIKEIEENVKKKAGIELKLDAFLLSVTPYEKVKDNFGSKVSKEDFERHKILFLRDEENYLEKLFRQIFAECLE
ncbi:Type III restriction enzyme, res subunit [Desulfurobacterium pacificum]|uniref:Type III restriction enzyme, res subunit n=1 Tax=Desulfurobacterium pacificum TaxID=240166 RepID=A0ABY1NH78_9BACT|nr:DEAD/DEAH box helicase family protein [Desulfurobacterium pacificum]SMP09000.1 Type III restriction enzyme, res subunit [Desulfurobacterium pacificum]